MLLSEQHYTFKHKNSTQIFNVFLGLLKFHIKFVISMLLS